MGNFTYDFDILVVVYENLRDNFNYASVFKISTKADGEEDEIFQLSVIGKDFCLTTSSETTVVSMNAKYCCDEDCLIIVKNRLISYVQLRHRLLFPMEREGLLNEEPSLPKEVGLLP